MSENFKAIVIDNQNDKFTREVKELDKSFLKDGDVLVKVEYSDLNFKDAMILKNGGKLVKEFPRIPGIDFSGTVEKADTDEFKEGDKVAYAAAPIGSYATHRIYPIKSLIKVPDGIDLEIIAAIMTKGLTTFYLLHKTYEAKSGETILFHAAAGGVGQIFCQWAKSLGCKIIGTVGSCLLYTSDAADE